MIALKIVVAASLLLSGSPVEADPYFGDVRQAVLRHSAKNGGVYFSTRTREKTYDLLNTETSAGAFRFNRSGIARSDVTYIGETGLGKARVRIITIGQQSYKRTTSLSGNPRSAKWEDFGNDGGGFHYAADVISGVNSAFLDLIEPDASAGVPGGEIDGVPTTLYTGFVDVPAFATTLAGVRFRFDPDSVGGRVNWRLWAGPDDLPRRFTASIIWDMAGYAESNETVNLTTFYKRWDTRVEIKAPPRKSVVKPW
ncbi:hypothetical protein [Acrocarpospora catenulata]|uniref:hypothetical protein n=1 Tax=Acrocarpospora catenulata TaxID=2836182 RepID=UPI001BD9467B|nr:hypothetical protein [Acrocarpospora catenulata]